jgi:subtilisin family serine protease
MVVPVRALSGLSGSLADLIEGILYVAGQGVGGTTAPGLPVARVINMSLGAELSAFGEADVLLFAAVVEAAADAGLLMVAAAGNGGADGIGRSGGIDVPARFPAVIAVGSVDRPDSSGEIVRSRFSDFGLELELVAPGAETSGWDGAPIEGIVSTWPANRYSVLPGTSMASPLVAGGAALVWSANPGLTAAELRRILQETAVDLGETGRDEEFGYGLLDVEAALRVALTAPWGPFEGSSLPTDPVPPDVVTRSDLRRSLSATIAAVEAAGDATGGNAAEPAPGTTPVGSGGALPALLVYAAPGTTVAILEATLRTVDESLAVAPLGVLPNGPLFRVTEIIQPTGSTGKDPSRDPERLRRVIEALAEEPSVLTVAVDRPIVLR